MRRLLLAITLFLAPALVVAQPVTNPTPVGDSGAYNAVPPTCTNGNFCWFQTDVNGNLKVVASGTPSGTQDVNITKWAGAVLGAATAYGTPPSGNVPGVNAYVTSIPQTGINISVTPTIQNASYVSGNCMGGFQTVAMGTSASVLSALTLSSQGGLVTAKQIYIFDANPSGSTCTDKGTFTIVTADLSKLLSTISMTPTVPTGTTKSTTTASGLGLGVPPGGNFYFAIIETATETPATTSDLVLNASGF